MTRIQVPDISVSALGKLAGPIFVANIAIIGSGTIDTIMAGRLGADHLAAIALGMAATICVMMSLVGILQGVSPIAGHHFGARKYHLIGQELHQNAYLAIILSIIGIALLSITDLWTSLGDVHGDVRRMATEFMLWSAAALPACLGARCFISINSAVSRPRVTMWISLALLALKVPTNGIFMYGWLGFPAMGGAGAGLSFCVLNYIALGAYLLMWKIDPYYKQMHAPRISTPCWSMLKAQLHVGLPIGLCTFFEVSSFTLMAIFVSRLGSEVISAHQIVANITSMLYMIPLSTGIATSVLIAQCLGAGWPSHSYTVLKRSLKITVAIAFVMSLLLLVSRSDLVWLYTKDPGVHQIAVTLLIFGVCYHIFDALQCVSAFSLRGYRVTTLPMLIYGVMLWGVGLGLGYYAAFHAQWAGGPYGAFGFWGMTAIGLFLTGISLAIMALFVGKNRALDDVHTNGAEEK